MSIPQRAHAQGPKPKPLLGNVADFGRDPLGFLTRSVEDYGPIVRLRLEAARDTYLISDPALVEHVLVSTNRTFAKGYQNVSSLSHTNRVIKEAMRLYPPVWWVSREVLEDWHVGDIMIPAGAEVGLSQWVMHHSSQFYDQPEIFSPERWTESFERTLPKYTYFPFGGGPRLCIGMSFALIEATLLLATLPSFQGLRLCPSHHLLFDLATD